MCRIYLFFRLNEKKRTTQINIHSKHFKTNFQKQIYIPFAFVDIPMSFFVYLHPQYATLRYATLRYAIRYALTNRTYVINYARVFYISIYKIAEKILLS
jgi:hypothetical protein